MIISRENQETPKITGNTFKITGNVIALERKGINEKSKFIPLAILFIVLFSLVLIKHIKKRW